MRQNRALVHATTLLAVLALASAPAAAAAEGQANEYDYRFAWSEHAFEGPRDGGETEEGASTNVTVDVTEANVTALRFRVTWKDTMGEPDTLHMAVFDPDGNERARLSDTQSNGTLEALVRVQETPPGQVTVRAASDEDAWAVFLTDYPASKDGAGAWRVQVTVEDAGDRKGTLAGIGGSEDTGQAWNLTVDGGAYAGVLAEKTLVENPQQDPDPAPDEMPPPDAAGGDDETPQGDAPEESTRDTSILASRGAQSALVVVAAAIGISGALLLARRGGSDA